MRTVTDRDSAFLWETEALRTGERHRRRVSTGGTLLPASDWVTLKEASELTGVPSETIRKWARRDSIPSFLEKTDDGHLRIVSIEGIRLWTDEIGRDLEWAEPITEDEPEQVVVDITDSEPAEVASTDPGVPEGSMLVPLDAWNKMLNQLGNLHEAGQQLAEARERAAKAETEASFLRERLAEMRAELEKARPTDQPEPVEPPEPISRPRASTTLGGTAASLARRLYEGWRGRRS